MDDELVRLRTELGEIRARVAYAAFLAETTFSVATMGMPSENVAHFIKHFARGLKKDVSPFQGEETLSVRVAGLFADFAARLGVKDVDG